MSTLDDLKDEVSDLETMQMIATAFTDAAATRIRNIRKAFETNQQFYAEISHVYHLVKLVAIQKGLVPEKPPGTQVLIVAFTANQHFYGNIHRRIMEVVIKEREKRGCSLMVIGKTGGEFMQVTGKSSGFDSMRFLKDNPTTDEIHVFTDRVRPYTSILVYYPHFVTLMRQEVGVIDITQVLDIGATEETKLEETYILFEPEVDKILEFFERQIRAILFARVVLESDLARTAARMVTMNEASERAVELMKQKHSEFLKVMRSLINRQLLDTFSGRSLWKS